MAEIQVQRKCSIEVPKTTRSRFWEFCESFGFAVIVVTFSVVFVLLLERAGIKFNEPSSPSATSDNR